MTLSKTGNMLKDLTCSYYVNNLKPRSMATEKLGSKSQAIFSPISEVRLGRIPFSVSFDEVAPELSFKLQVKFLASLQ